MPIAPPNSWPVSSSAAAEPARSGGTVPIAMSVTSDITATIPLARTAAPISTVHSESGPARARIP